MSRAANISNYEELAASVTAKETPLNIVSPEIVWPAGGIITINYNSTVSSASSTDQVVFNGQNQSVLFQLTSGMIHFTGSFLFIDATSEGTRLSGGAIVGSGARVQFNGNTIFRGNRARVSGGAIEHSNPITFNGNAIFTNNSAQTDGGAIMASIGDVTLNGSATFRGNNAGEKGGAIYCSRATININARDPSTPVLFSDNTPQGIYLAGLNARLNLNAAEGTIIDIQDGVAGDNVSGLITKTGLGIWKQGGNSSAYLGKTNITAGVFVLQPAAIYGTPDSGAVTLGPDGALIYTLGPEDFPLLQAASITLNGEVTVAGFPGIPNPIGAAVVARATTPIIYHGETLKDGEHIAEGTIPFYRWQLIAKGSTELILLINPE